MPVANVDGGLLQAGGFYHAGGRVARHRRAVRQRGQIPQRAHGAIHYGIATRFGKGLNRLVDLVAARVRIGLGEHQPHVRELCQRAQQCLGFGQRVVAQRCGVAGN
ncbi:hypothetical protein SDC9_195157 [bioreactor metagenome]|uniref:Uncharacterized protein n=1 Tax=bioreactor metagenome TaxID=1076179 RepID=A0A645IGX1_9ZZZZ